MLKDGDFLKLAKDLNYTAADDLIAAVGYGRISPRKVLNNLLPKSEEASTVQKEVGANDSQATGKSSGVTIKGIGDIMTKLAKCCNPVPGDPIIGFSSRGRGVIVHRADCASVATMEPERLLNVTWEGREDDSAPFPARIRTTFVNKRGMLSTISGVIDTEGANIGSGTLRSTVDGKSELDLLVEVSDVVHLLRILGKIRNVDSVYEVKRITGAEH